MERQFARERRDAALSCLAEVAGLAILAAMAFVAGIPFFA